MSSAALRDAMHRLRKRLEGLPFPPRVTHIYNPLDYAAAPHEEYLSRFGAGRKRVLFLGMNPGPFGMAQTGVPFGEIAAVRDWMGIHAPVGKPKPEHPKRPVLGFNCEKSEVSGRRLWGLFAQRFDTAEKFFRDHFVANWCPLAFMTESGANLTPDKVDARAIQPVIEACDEHLRRVIEILQPEWLIGVGGFAEACLKRVCDGRTAARIARILHPSPASPAANKDWPGNVTRTLEKLGVWK
jgi:single-strand selective monofunctional uracil DNA glycosylase